MPVYKGSYTETLTAAIAAFRAKQAPHIVQVFEVGTANMMAAKGAVYPVYQLMADAKEPFDPKAYIGPVYGYYSTTDGKLLSMPFNSSTPVLYWNKELLAKAGLDPNKPPTTWPELGEMAKKAVAAGAKCGFTPQWQTWTMIENYGAWHNLPYATKDNGFGGTDIELKFNDAPRVKFIQMLADWSKDKTFVYGGREGKSTALFTAGDCVFHIASSAYGGGDRQGAGHRQGRHRHDALLARRGAQAAELDHRRRHAVGAAGQAEGRIQGRRQVPDLPGERAGAGQVAPGDGLRAGHPGRRRHHREGGLLQEVPRPRHRGEGAHAQPADGRTRRACASATSCRSATSSTRSSRSVWSGKKDAKAALDEAVKRGNELLRKFEAANK